MRFVPVLVCLLGVGARAAGLLAADSPATLMRMVPDSANVVSVIDVERLHGTARGQAEAWKAEHDTAFLGGATVVPSNARFVLHATHVQPDIQQNSWSLTLMALPANWTIKQVAGERNGAIEQIGNQPVVATPDGLVLAQLPGAVLAGITPPVRQDVSRYIQWARAAERSEASPFLTRSVETTKAPILIAMDLKDLLDPGVVTAYLSSSPALAGREKDVEIVQKLMATVEGMTFEAVVDDRIYMRTIFYFPTTPTQQAVALKDVLNEFLADRGAAIEDLEKAEVTIEPKSLVLNGELSDDGLRKVLSLVRLPSAGRWSNTETAEIPAEKRALAANRRYYVAIYRMLEDLSRISQKSQNYVRTALWHDNYARDIDDLDRRDVDERLLTYGRTVSGRLRQLAASLRGDTREVARIGSYADEQVTVTPPSGGWSGGFPGYGWGGFPGYWGGGFGGGWYQPGTYNVQTNYAEIRGKQADAVAKGANQREEIWRQMVDDQNKIRDEMLKKYDVDFTPAPRKSRTTPGPR